MNAEGGTTSLKALLLLLMMMMMMILLFDVPLVKYPSTGYLTLWHG